jgi:hypothetical protein
MLYKVFEKRLVRFAAEIPSVLKCVMTSLNSVHKLGNDHFLSNPFQFIIQEIVLPLDAT